MLLVFWGLYTILVLLGFGQFLYLGKEDFLEKLFSTPSSFKFFSMFYSYVGILVLIVGLNDFWKDNSFIVNIFIFLLPLLFFYKIYDDGVKNKGYSELDSFTYVTYLIGWMILVPVSIFYWYMIIVG
ncbi:MAG: hypothetical protein CML98_02880 [Rhodobiaceae bacterium]|nr:hypothetical protein [Rhodobiaceae bacterium]|tara:strand:- start:521 stop:901 length:381 start_codon:yes stop_codon:yes gene_type:complete